MFKKLLKYFGLTVASFFLIVASVIMVKYYLVGADIKSTINSKTTEEIPENFKIALDEFFPERKTCTVIALFPSNNNVLRRDPCVITYQFAKLYQPSNKSAIDHFFSGLLGTIYVINNFKSNEIEKIALNQIYCGSSGKEPIWGIFQASQYYYHKDAKLLSLNEAREILQVAQSGQFKTDLSDQEHTTE